MKIQCNACEAAEATVMCCADEAALCDACDQKVHAANKLAGKHQRVPLLLPAGAGAGAASTVMPTCDICQEASGYFFCLEDRALLCRSCDVAVHTANSFVSAHHRFLLTGIQVGLEPTAPVASFAKEQVHCAAKVSDSTTQKLQNGNPSITIYDETQEIFSSQLGTDGGDLAANKDPFSGSFSVGNLSDWPLNDFFGFPDLNDSYGFAGHGFSKADSGKLGSSEGSPPHYIVNEGLDADEYLGQVPEVPWVVSKIPSPPTASGLNWPRSFHDPASENVMFVPDICYSQNAHQFQAKSAAAKRRRAC